MDLSPGELHTCFFFLVFFFLFFFWGWGGVYNSEELLNLRIRNCCIFAHLSKHGKTIHSPFNPLRARNALRQHFRVILYTLVLLKGQSSKFFVNSF